MEHASTSPPSVRRAGAILALIRRDFLIERSYRAFLALDIFYGVLNLLVYFFISRTFHGVPGANLGGAPSYFAFAVVGIAITVVLDAASTGLARRVREEQLTGTLEALLAQPVRGTELALGLGGLPFLFATGRAAFYLAVAALWLDVDLSRASWLGFVVVLSATGAAMGSIGIAAGALVLIVKRGEALAAMVIFGMGLVGGALFPISVLPGWLQPLGKIVPTRFAFSGLRAAMFVGDGWWDEALVLLLFSIVSLPVAVWLFSRALAFGKRSGSLAQY